MKYTKNIVLSQTIICHNLGEGKQICKVGQPKVNKLVNIFSGKEPQKKFSPNKQLLLNLCRFIISMAPMKIIVSYPASSCKHFLRFLTKVINFATFVCLSKWGGKELSQQTKSTISHKAQFLGGFSVGIPSVCQLLRLQSMFKEQFLPSCALGSFKLSIWQLSIFSTIYLAVLARECTVFGGLQVILLRFFCHYVQ